MTSMSSATFWIGRSGVSGVPVRATGRPPPAGSRDMVDRLDRGRRADRRRVGVRSSRESAIGRSDAAIGRPAIGRALVAAGHARDLNDAFDRFLAEGRPAYVPRRGASPETVGAGASRIGAVASLAHPGKMKRDDILPRLARAGMQAIEVFHPDHDAADIARYQTTAAALDLVPTGGSDYHGPDTDRAKAFGPCGAGRQRLRAATRVP